MSEANRDSPVRDRYEPIHFWKRRQGRDHNALVGAIESCTILLVEARARLVPKPGETDSQATARLAVDPVAAQEWLEVAEESLHQAEMARRKRAFDQAWRHFQAAYRCQVFWIPKEQIAAWVISLRNEAADKLSKWRAKTVKQLLAGECVEEIPRHWVHAAMETRDDHAANQYRKVMLLQDKLQILAWTLLALLIALLGLAVTRVVSIDGNSSSSPRVLLGVVLLGALAGALSAIMPISLGKNHRGRVPEQLMSWSVTLVRPLIGAAAGLASYLLVLAHVVTIGDGNPGAIWATAFAAGFSEKWLVTKMGIGTDTEPSNRDEKGNGKVPHPARDPASEPPSSRTPESNRGRE